MSISKERILGDLYDQVKEKPEIEKLYKKNSDNNEFEFMFYANKREEKMGMDKFLKILEYLNVRSERKKEKLENTVNLDIIYSTNEGNYRITLSGLEDINKYMKMLHKRENHVIFRVLVGLSEKDKRIKIIKKKRSQDSMGRVDIEDFNMRVRLSNETEITNEERKRLNVLDEKQREKIIFRYKQRVSLVIEENENLKQSIDLTTIKMTNRINRIENIFPDYELEIDLTNKTNKPITNDKYLRKMYDEATNLLKILQQSNYIISQSLEREVLLHYNNLLGIKKERSISLEGRKPQSLEIQHVVDILPNRYAVTDKADGDRYFLIIYEMVVFLISDNLHVKNTGIILKKNQKEYNNSILDGELILIKEKNRYLFMCFDCLIRNNEDIRQNAILMDRLKIADEIINNCFIFEGQKGYSNKSYEGEYNSEKIIKFNERQISIFLENLSQDLNTEKSLLLIRRKYFIAVYGAQNNEIFKYSELIWNKYVIDKDSKCPYILDGLIYHPLNQKYIVSVKESKYLEYKWKPPTKNSIDFYIRYEKNRINGKILTLFDNSYDLNLADNEEDPGDEIKNKPYRIVNLYVGYNNRGQEQPILFEPEAGIEKHIAYLFLQDNEIRDENGDIIQDETVVEFYYNNDPNIPDKQRWVPIRTRYDKTESVHRFGKKYGNYSDIAYKIWRSIRNPFLIEDIALLAKDDIYDKQINILRGKIDHSVILSERKENIYFQIRNILGKPLRNFHNWIKSIVLYTHINPEYENGKQSTILDFKCGRGEDLMRYYYGEVKLYVGLDKDNNSIISPVNGAVSRYNQLRKTHPNFPRMFFINADSTLPLEYEDQIRIIGNNTPKNRDLMDNFFPKDKNKKTIFDRIMCLQSFSDFFLNDSTWENLLLNLNNHLKPGGYFIVLSFDADTIINLLKNKNQYTVYYTNNNGEQQILYEIVKKYEEDDLIKNNLGLNYDIYNSLEMQEGTYITENLIRKDFVEKELLKKCNLELVETDLYENQFKIHKNYFMNCVQYEDVDKTKKFLNDVREYYTSKTDFNLASYNYTKLFRFYIFRKKDFETEQSTLKNKKTNMGRLKINPSKGDYNNASDNARPHFSRRIGKQIRKRMEGGEIENNNLNSSEEPFSDLSEFLNPKKFIKKHQKSNKYSFQSSILDVLKNDKIVPVNLKLEEFLDDISCELIEDKNINENKIQQILDNLIIGHENNIEYPITNTNISESENTSLRRIPSIILNGLNVIISEKDCNDMLEISVYSKNTSSLQSDTKQQKTELPLNKKTCILYFDGNTYSPIYKKTQNSNKKKGLFDSNKKWLIDFINQD